MKPLWWNWYFYIYGKFSDFHKDLDRGLLSKMSSNHRKNLITLTAFMIFPSLCSRMFYKICMHWKCLVTLATVVWLLSSVYSQMTFKKTFVRKFSYVGAALVCVLPRVYPQMFYENFIQWKWFVTMPILMCFSPL